MRKRMKSAASELKQSLPLIASLSHRGKWDLTECSNLEQLLSRCFLSSRDTSLPCLSARYILTNLTLLCSYNWRPRLLHERKNESPKEPHLYRPPTASVHQVPREYAELTVLTALILHGMEVAFSLLICVWGTTQTHTHTLIGRSWRFRGK